MKRVVEEPLTATDSAAPPRRIGIRFVGNALFVLLILLAALVGALSGFLLVYSTDLPQVTELEHYRPSTITQLYDDQNRVIGQFALQRRVIDSYNDFPKVLRDALISTEDKEFEQHWGVDVWRVFGAAWRDILLDSRAQGASTLTMQLARNLFLSPDRNFRRKMQEVMLSIQIERRFTKPQIFTLYANQIYLGHGVYGFEAGANYYFSKKAKDLTLEEAAVLAGLAQSSERLFADQQSRARAAPPQPGDQQHAGRRQDHRRGSRARQELAAGRSTCRAEPNDIAPVLRGRDPPVPGEEVRNRTRSTKPVCVFTPRLNLEMQHAAQQAVRDGLAAYERRHGWKGNLLNVVANGDSLATYHHVDWDGDDRARQLRSRAGDRGRAAMARP